MRGIDTMTVERPRVPWFVSFLARRLVWALITLVIFMTAVFFFMQVWVPYSWATQFGVGGPGAMDAAREAAGLNRPLLERYADFMGGLATGDLGTSFGGAPVVDLIRDALPVTLTVFIVGAIIGWVVGELLGRVGTWSRHPISGGPLSVLAVLSATIFPPFLVFVLVEWLRDPLLGAREAIGLPTDSLELWRGAVTGQPGALSPDDVRWLVALAPGWRRSWSGCSSGPTGVGTSCPGWRASRCRSPSSPSAWGSGSPGSVRTPSTCCTGSTSRSARGAGLRPWPCSAIVLISFGQVLLLMRAGMEAERAEDYVLTGRAKGLTERAVRDRHVARNVLAPVLAGSFLTFPTVLAGMIIVEYELEMQGLSSVLFDAIEFQDIPVIMGVIVVLGLIGIGFRLVTDVTIAVLDPRQRRGRV